MIKTNVERLAKFKIQGNIIPPAGGDAWRTGHDGKARMVPGVGGITLNFKIGDLANRYLSDHLEPGVSTTWDGKPTERGSNQNAAYNTFSCVGNEVTVLTGAAKGKKGMVTGHHGGAEHVMVDFDDKTLDLLTYDDKVMITCFGVGLELAEFAGISLFSLSPNLLSKMKMSVIKNQGASPKLEVEVAAMAPAVVMGSGIGGNRPYKGDYDIQTSDQKTNELFKLDQLKIGDLVAIIDHDSHYGWSYKQGAISIGVIIHGDSYIAGHGPGCQTLMTSVDGLIVPKLSKNANIGHYLGLGRYRKSRK